MIIDIAASAKRYSAASVTGSSENLMFSTCLQIIPMSVFRHENGLKLRQKVRAVIVNPVGEFLLVRPHGYREGEWTLAGGGVEHGETVHEAMRREIAEELVDLI